MDPRVIYTHMSQEHGGWYGGRGVEGLSEDEWFN